MNAALAIRWTNFFDEITKRLPSCAITNASGDALFIRPTTLADIGTLAVAAQTVTQYIKLKPGQIVIVNDLASGGTSLQTFTLVGGISLNSSKDADLIIASRFRTRPSLQQPTINDLRIPPTPLVGFEGFSYEDIFKAIATHPTAPHNFTKRLLGEVEKLQSCLDQIKSSNTKSLNIKKPFIEKFLALSQERHHKFLDEIPFETVTVAKDLDATGRIQLRIHNASDGLHLDFTGSDTPYKCTQSMTVGACLGAIKAFLKINLPLTHGHFRNVIVHTPIQSSLNANPQSLTPLSELILVPLIANTVIEALSKMMKKAGTAECGLSVLLEVQFKNGATFFERLPGGSGATARVVGIDAVDVWTRLPLQPSIEDMETLFPLSIVRSERRTGSGGRGVHSGGSGSRRTFHFLEPATLRWALEQARIKPSGTFGGSNGDSAELTLHRANGENVELNGTGTIEIQKDDTLTILSAGGGGYGRAE